MDNETEAIEKFRKKLNSSDNYFNDKPFPGNESDTEAHAQCSSIEKAKENCPERWEALQSWFKEARMVRIERNIYKLSGSQRSIYLM